MTNLAENQKDLQIQRQAEEIESLNRKVQSLEAELQKCLDPDSGEINPSIRYHYKTGEAALIEKVKALEKQLGNCLDDQEGIQLRKDIVPNQRLYSFIINIGASLFCPLEYHDCDLNRDMKDNTWGIWSRLVYILIERPEFMDLWSNTEFRRAVNLINETGDFLHSAQLNEAKAMDDYKMAADCLCNCSDDDHQAMKTLRIVLERLYKIEWNERDVDLERREIDYLVFAVQIIIQCQRLSRIMTENSK